MLSGDEEMEAAAEAKQSPRERMISDGPLHHKMKNAKQNKKRNCRNQSPDDRKSSVKRSNVVVDGGAV
jgi:predicted Holliday junction resolvase-like endonuclease